MAPARKVLDGRDVIRDVPRPRIGDDRVLADIRGSLRGEYPIWTRLVPAVVVGAIAWWAVYRIGLVLMPLDGRGVMVTAVLAGGLVAFAILSAARRMDVARANALFIKHKVCVCCGYELKSLPEEADGCVVCPECGAAWQFGPRGRDTPQ